MNLVRALKRHGIVGTVSKGLPYVRTQAAVWYHRRRLSDAPRYASPAPEELRIIEQRLAAAGVEVLDFSPSPEDFGRFKSDNWFPPGYHGGRNSGVWDEKLLEHWISYTLLDLPAYDPTDVFVDIAAAGSPWARELRRRLGIAAFANDLGPVPFDYRALDYYRSEDATNSAFEAGSVRGAALHCAFEMFVGEHDKLMIDELARILEPGGKAIVLPLYMHTHPCAYASPEYFGKGYADAGATEYVRFEVSNIPSSRKYDAVTLQDRVLDRIRSNGMSYRLHALRNKESLGDGIYCHFILEIMK